MQKVYSNINNEKLLHIVVKKEDVTAPRWDVIDPSEPLQVAAKRDSKGKRFKEHQHIPCKKTVRATQESWVVIEGKIKVFLYDIDGALLLEDLLERGDFLVTLYGGHSYETLEDDTLVYEFKTGPYLGVKKDKKTF